MKKLFKIFLSVFILLAIAGCDKDDDDLGVDLEGMALPSDLKATFQITQDNTGLVTVTPTGQGANLFSVDFGDGSAPSEEIRVGESVTHVYAEGTYDVVITGTNLAGDSAQGTQPLNVSFRAPENLEVTIAKDPEDNYTVAVSATADYAAMFNVYFGDIVDEEPTPLMAGETVSHTYETTGAYNVRVVALSGGEATLETEQEVTISDPLFLPVDFESDKLAYDWIGFGGANGQIIDNPDMSGINTSSKVVELTKGAGAETWAGISLALDEPLDFSQGTVVTMKVWSPEAGVPVLFKIEDTSSEPDANGNPSVFVEVIENTTTSGTWEELTFDLSSSERFDPSVSYDKAIVFYDFGQVGEGSTFYFDDINLTKLELVSLPLTFENENLTYSWNGFGGAGGAVVANPDQSGMNTSANVTELNEGAGAETWAGMSLNLDRPLDFSDGTTVKMKVWSPEAGVPILLKFENSASAPAGGGNPTVFVEVISNTTTSGEWEEMSFDLSTFGAFDPAVNYDRIIIFYDFGNTGEDTTSYYDDITIGDTQYISLFSDIADDVVVDTWRTDWSVSDYEEVTFEGRLAKHYYNLNYVGIETIANPVDASEMTHFHTDFYTDNATVFKVKLVDLGPDGLYGGGDDSEHEITIENPAQNEWVSLDIPLSDFENLAERAHIGQLIYSAAPSNAANVYVTNVYFHN